MNMRLRRIIIIIFSLVSFGVVILAAAPPIIENKQKIPISVFQTEPTGSASKMLEELPVKGRAPKTDYSRSQFGNGWATTSGCDTRNIILHRDLQSPVVDEKCIVVAGRLDDPYTATIINFTRGSSNIQIDHVVALSNTWQTGAQSLSRSRRIQLANDPLELLAVQGDANQQKSDGDAATWLPSNKSFRCEYVARQIAVKQKYMLWVTTAEKQAIIDVLGSCSSQSLPAK
jgi:hypothetical protein